MTEMFFCKYAISLWFIGYKYTVFLKISNF